MLHIVLSPVCAFSYLILVLFTFCRVEDCETGENKTLIEVTQPEAARNPSSQVRLAPEPVLKSQRHTLSRC